MIGELEKEKKMGLAMILANYAKRKLEGVYDNFSESNLGESLKALDSNSKYALELALYLVSAIADRKLDEKGFWAKIIKEIGVDATPELAKRFLNGESVKKNTGLTRTILELDNKWVLEFVEWISGLDEEERNSILQKIEGVSKEELEKILEIAPENRKSVLELLSSKKPKKKFSEKIENQLDAIIRNLKKKENGNDNRQAFRNRKTSLGKNGRERHDSFRRQGTSEEDHTG